ncbi:ribonuclease P protein component [Buchnera aphidicola]|uniref:ribonuclease P protein component n=1 Tax=Buchnera aphidicola TaxID=9 RepID=UPI00094BF915|nr:ribonuclease P protein component [Buchnera aphidicola]
MCLKCLSTIKNTPYFAFSKKLRLLSNIAFQRCNDKKNKAHTTEFIRLVSLNHLNFPRLGISISKKNIKKSHERNRIKRLIRESFRLSQYTLVSMDFCIIVKKNVQLLTNNIIFSVLKKLWVYKHYNKALSI